MKKPTFPAFQLITENTELSLAIAEHVEQSGTLRDNRHILIVSAVYHADEHKNTTPLLELVDGLANTQGVGEKTISNILAWLKSFTTYDFKLGKDGKKSKVYTAKRPQKRFTRKDALSRAQKTAYWMIDPANKNSPKEFDAIAFLTRALTTLADKIGETDEKQRSEIAAKLLAASQELNRQNSVESADTDAGTDTQSVDPAQKKAANQ